MAKYSDVLKLLDLQLKPETTAKFGLFCRMALKAGNVDKRLMKMLEAGLATVNLED